LAKLSDESEIRKRLCEGLTGPTNSVVFDSSLVDFEAVRRVLLKSSAGELVENRIIEAKINEEEKGSILVVRLKEKECIISCDEKCGSRDTPCFGDCFFTCLSGKRDEAEEKLCR